MPSCSRASCGSQEWEPLALERLERHQRPAHPGAHRARGSAKRPLADRLPQSCSAVRLRTPACPPCCCPPPAARSLATAPGCQQTSAPGVAGLAGLPAGAGHLQAPPRQDGLCAAWGTPHACRHMRGRRLSRCSASPATATFRLPWPARVPEGACLQVADRQGVSPLSASRLLQAASTWSASTHMSVPSSSSGPGSVRSSGLPAACELPAPAWLGCWDAGSMDSSFGALPAAS